jgi:phage-related protein
MDVILGSTDLLVVDTKAKTVFINGTDRYDIVRSDNQWWALLPGSNSLLYTRSSTSGNSTATVKFRDAYTTA